MSTDNPLLIKSTQAFGTEPFDEIEKEHFLPALTASLSEAEAEIEQITNNSEAPSFENTILALELSGSSLNRVSTVYFHLFGSESDQEFQDLAMEISDNPRCRCADDHILNICPCRYQHRITITGCINGFLDGGYFRRYLHHTVA